MARIPVDFSDPDADTQALQDYTSRLPVELPQPQPGYTHTYQPGWDAQLAQEEANKANPLVFAPAIREGLRSAGQLISGEKQLASPSEMLSHVVGPNRLQMWPEQMIRSGFTLGRDVNSGELPTTVPDEYGEYHTNPELIQRAQDIAGMAGGGLATTGERIVNNPGLDFRVMGKKLLSDTSETASLTALERVPVFYSALEHAVTNAKMPKADADQWLGYLRNQPGVKQEELDWVLHDLPKGQITKPELEQYVNEHKVELKEVNKGAPTARLNEISGRLQDVMKERNRLGLEPDSAEVAQKKADLNKEHDALYAELRQLQSDRYSSDPQHAQWQLPGGTSYREMIMTLPESGEVGQALTRMNDSYRIQTDAISKYKKLAEEKGQGDPETKAAQRQWLDAAKEADKLSDEYKALKAANPSYTHSHWPGIINPVAHIRMNDRVIPSVGKSLHIEEGQSDLHQAGRHQGYVGEKEKLQPQFDAIEKKILDSNDEAVMSNPELKDALAEAVKKKIITIDEARTYQRYSDINAQQTAGQKPVMDAPFKKDATVDLILKRMIRQAAEEGKSAISWTPGQAQADRYDLSKQVDHLQLEHYPDSKQLFAYDKNGNSILTKQIKNDSELADHIGKEAAEKLLNQEKVERGRGNIPTQRLDNADLKIGGEFHKRLYDETWVNKANAIAKKFGGKVEQSEIPPNTENIDKFNDIAQQLGSELRGKKEGQPIHVLRITPQLRDAALNKGFSLFADTGKVGAPLAALTRVEHNPFKLGELEKQHGVNLTPVDHNPFTVDTYHGTGGFKGTEIEPKTSVNIHHDVSSGTDEYRVWDQVNRKYMSQSFKTKAEAEKWVQEKVGSEFFSAANPELGSGYAEFAAKPAVLPLKLNIKDYHTFDANGKPWQSANADAIYEANQLGKKGVIIKNVRDNPTDQNDIKAGLGKDHGPQTVYITLDPSTVRSRFAKFDPKSFGESGLLKSDSGEVGKALSALTDRAKRNGVNIDTSVHDGLDEPILIHWIERAPKNVDVPRAGAQIINEVSKIADEHGKKIQLIAMADNEPGGQYLPKFYKSLGFKKTGEMTPDGPIMIRMPNAKNSKKMQEKLSIDNLLKSAGIPIEINNQNGQDPFIDNTHTVPYGASASNNGFVVHIDSSIPRFDPHTGDLDLYKPLALHERTEKKLMDTGMPYEYAHKIATEAEKSYVGDRWKEYEKVMDGYLSKTENEKPSNPPSNLYLKPYPHNKQELLEKYGTHTPEETEHESVGISGKTAAIGAAKAAEWAAFIGARNYPKIAGPMYASWVAQWPLLGHMLKADIRKQLNAGVKPEDIEFKPGTIGDLFGLVSKLRAKYGDKADKLEPVDHDPFKE